MPVDQVNHYMQQLQQGHVESALSGLQEVMQDTRMSDPLRFEIAERLLQFGFVQESVLILEQLHRAHPEEGEIILLLAECYLENGNETEAVAVLDTIPVRDALHAQASLYVAEMYAAQGLFEVAEHKLKQALDHHPQQSILYTALGEIFYMQEKYELALLNYERNSEWIGAYKIADCYVHLGQFEQAIPYYEQAIRENDSADVRYAYAFVCARLKNWTEALNQLRVLIEMDSHYASAYSLLVEACMNEGQWEDALYFVSEGLRIDETNPSLYVLRGKLLSRSGKSEEARQSMHEALHIDDEYVPALEELIELFVDLQEWDNVRSYTEQLLHILPERVDMWITLGITSEELEEWDEAHEYYVQARKIDPLNTTALNRHAFLLRDEGHMQKALQLWRESLTIDADQEDIQQIVDQYDAF